MSRLRSIAHVHLLPLVIGALVLRALIPVGFMPGAGPGASLTAALCAPTGNSVDEVIEIPRVAPALHCDYCVTPLWGAAPDFTLPGEAPDLAARPLPARLSAPFTRFALERSQVPRGPPRADSWAHSLG